MPKTRPKKGHRGGARAKPARSVAVPRDLPTNGARETARTLLGQLEALRAKLDADIATVRALSEVL